MAVSPDCPRLAIAQRAAQRNWVLRFELFLCVKIAGGERVSGLALFVSRHCDENFGSYFYEFRADIAVFGYTNDLNDAFTGLNPGKWANDPVQPLTALELSVKVIDAEPAQGPIQRLVGLIFQNDLYGPPIDTAVTAAFIVPLVGFLSGREQLLQKHAGAQFSGGTGTA
jgi:hypothetical protein